MSLAERGKALLESAEAKRGEWVPKPGSWYFKYYEEYRRRLPNVKIGRCDFFHIVFRQLLFKMGQVFLVILGLAAIATLVILAIKFSAGMLVVGSIVAAFLYVIVGLNVSAHLAYRYIDNVSGAFKFNWMDRRSDGVQGLLALVFLPVEIVVAIVVLLGWSLIQIFFGALESDAAEWFFTKEVAGRSWLHPVAFVPAVVFIALLRVPGFWQVDLFLVGIITLVTLLFLMVVGIATWYDNMKDKREAAVRTAEDQQYRLRDEYVSKVLVRRVFSFYHPQWVVNGVVDELKFSKWLERYEGYCEEKHGMTYDTLHWRYHFDYINKSSYEKIYGESLHETYMRLCREYEAQRSAMSVELKLAKPSLMQKILHGIGRGCSAVLGFFVYLWTLVLYLKRVRCPMMVDPSAVTAV